jgi:uncharacterized protein
MHLSALIATVLMAVVQPQNSNLRVHDFANLLSADQRAELESIARDVEQKTTAQIAVVTVNSLDGLTVENYAHELFEKWGIGKKNTNNGVLFLIAPQERRMKIEVGRGVERLLTDSLSGEICDKHVVPQFKQGDYPAGIIAGTHELASVLLADPAGARGDPNSTPMLARTARRNALAATTALGIAAVVLLILSFVVAARRLYSTTTFVLVSTVAAVLLALAAYFLWHTPKVQQPIAWFGGATFASIAAWGFNWKKYRRFGPHGCSKCGTQLELLSEQDDDPKLSSVQQLEEKIGSVDYDVWICPACLNQDTERYINRFSGFTDCQKCHGRTFKEDPQEVIRSPTTFSTGQARVEGRCVSCNYKTVRNIVLPIIVTSTSSGGSSGGSFGGGGGWSGGGGGGGFGGGSSGGGGASRGW